jgi:hypothetical protein
MKLGYVTVEGRGRTDALIAEVAELARARGLRLAGTVQFNPERAGRSKCDMDLALLPDGPVFRISEDRGDLARGCRLDGGALEAAVALVEARLADAQLVIVNKFGKHESGGRGFAPVIAAALERDLPVLVGVNRLNRDAFDAFSGGLAEAIDPDPDAVMAWLDRPETG